MLVMLLVGMMNLAWMAILLAVMLAERFAPVGRFIALAGGCSLLAVALVVLVDPTWFPALV